MRVEEKKIIEKVELLKDEMIQAIQEISRIDSTRKETRENMPYGEGIDRALHEAMKHAQKLGFKTRVLGNQVGIAQWGAGEEYLAIVGHLDVVEATGNWKSDPFQAEIRNNRIYGRGVLDNKGPLYANLFALYALKECGYNFKTQVRILFGTNEETGMEDMKEYLNHEVPPVLGWTPDCKYPVVYAERGCCTIEIQASQKEKFYEFVNTYILNNQSLEESLAIVQEDEEFGNLQVRTIQLQPEDKILMSVSYPSSVDVQVILEKISQKAQGCECCIINNIKPVFFDKDTWWIKELSKTYEEITGLDGTPVSTTGGTYAKIIPNIVPFGPSFPGQKGIAHAPNEWLDIDDLMNNTKIYALSLYRCLIGMEKW